MTIWEALTNTRPASQPPLYEEDSQLERCVDVHRVQSWVVRICCFVIDLCMSVSDRAIQESLSLSLTGGDGEESDPGQPISPPDPNLNSPPCYSLLAEPRAPGAFAVASTFDEQLRIAMELSCREQEELDR